MEFYAKRHLCVDVWIYFFQFGVGGFHLVVERRDDALLVRKEDARIQRLSDLVAEA